MASDNQAYTQFGGDDSSLSPPPPRYGTNGGNSNMENASVAASAAADDGGKTLEKRWKNSRRLCWALLSIGCVATVLEIAGACVTGVHLDWMLDQFVAGVWLAALGVVAAAVGLRAFRNSYENSKCWTLTHFVTCVVATAAYGILLVISSMGVYSSRMTLEEYYKILAEDYEYEYAEAEQSSTAAAAAPQNSTGDVIITTTAQVDAAAAAGDQNSTDMTTTMEPYQVEAILHAIRAELAICVFLVGVTLAFLVVGIIANIIMCRQWCCKRGQKTMTIVYTSQDQQTGSPQTQTVVVPTKTQVINVMVSPSKPGATKNN